MNDKFTWFDVSETYPWKAQQDLSNRFRRPSILLIGLFMFALYLQNLFATTVDRKDPNGDAARGLVLDQCEKRVLMSADPTPLLRPEVLSGLPAAHAPLNVEQSQSHAAESHAAESGPAREDSSVYFAAAPGSGNTLPVLDASDPWIIDGEDNNPREIDLREFFSDAEQSDNELKFELLNVTNSSLFTQATVGIDGDLHLAYAPNANGDAYLRVRVRDGEGGALDTDLRVSVLPTNDWPTTTGLSDVSVRVGADTTVIDLHQLFNDVEDADSELNYEVTANSNPGLFQSVVLDQQTGKLTLAYKEGAIGSTDLTVRATDSGGKYVETSRADADLPIYDWLLTDDAQGGHFFNAGNPDTVGLDQVSLISSWALFPLVNGGYVEHEIDEAILRTSLQSMTDFAPGRPVVIDIENQWFTNTPEGRLKFARILEIVQEERPDLLEVGFYSNRFPGSHYFAPVQFLRAESEIAYAPTAYYQQLREQFRPNYDGWLASNDTARTAALGGAYGNTTLKDMLSLVNPSMYTHYRYGHSSHDWGASEVIFAGATNSVHGVSLANDTEVQFYEILGNSAPVGIEFSEMYFDQSPAIYYVVNAGENQFQVSTEIGGDPVVLNFVGETTHRVGAPRSAARSLEHDVHVKDWGVFANAMIEEAKKFDTPVISWLSPSFEGIGQDFLDKDYFRFQLETVRQSGVDGIALFDFNAQTSEEDPGWWQALTEFQVAMNTPTQFTVNVAAPFSAAINPPKITQFAGGNGAAGIVESATGEGHESPGSARRYLASSTKVAAFDNDTVQPTIGGSTKD